MKKIISLIVACVLLLGLCACGGDNAETNEDKVFKVGDTAKLKDVEVTFVGITEHEGSEYIKPADGKVFVLCEFEISNNSDEDLVVSSLMNFKAYCDDYSCDVSFGALVDTDEKEQLDGTVAAGKKLKGVIGYEIASDWKELEIRYQPDLLRNDKLVFVANNG